MALVEVGGVERRGQSGFVHQCYASAPMVVLQHGVVVVQAGQVRRGGDEKLLVETRMIQVMANGRDDGGDVSLYSSR